MRQVEFYSYDYFTSLPQLSLKMEQITTVPWAYFRSTRKAFAVFVHRREACCAGVVDAGEDMVCGSKSTKGME